MGFNIKLAQFRFILVFIFLVLLFTGCSSENNSQKNIENSVLVNDNSNNNLPSIISKEDNSQEYIIYVNNKGFSPNNIEINKGDIIIFINNGDDRHWPASNAHPTHNLYPGSDIEKCETVDEKNIFDACGSIKTGENYTFRFNEVGTWNFHDHVHSTLKGTIIVK